MSVDAVPTVETGSQNTASDHYRYPGSPPFQDDELDRRLFKGRAKEADHVLHSILSSDLFLLYSVSGLGKTSLLNAGVMQRLRDRGYWPVSVRLNDINQAPAEQIREQMQRAAAADAGIELLRSPDAPQDADTARSLWELLTSIEVWRGNELQEIVLILDQFEELFTLGWNEAEQQAFIADFGEVVRGHRTYGSLPAAGFERGPDVKMVLAMREDALGELEALSADVPQIMANRFRLGPLDPVQAEHAIREPAGLSDPRLGSQRFTYTSAAASELLDFLRTKTLNGSIIQTAAVDPSQLQIVCHYVERAIVPKKAATQPPDSVVEIDAADLGGREGLNRILSDFYRRTIESFPGRTQAAVRDLCESGLINRNERRLSLEQGEVETTYKVSPEMLEQLVDARMLRSEPRVGSVYYELAHDTLVRPILAYRDRQRRQRSARRLRRIAIAAGVVIIALFVAGFGFGSSRPSRADLQAQEQAIEVATAATAAANEAADLATVAGAAAAQAVEAAGTAATAAAEERQRAVAALAQAQAAAVTAQIPEAADEAQPPEDLNSPNADFQIGQAAAGAANAAAAVANEATTAAQDAARLAQDAADETDGTSGETQAEAAERAQEQSNLARAAADRASAASGAAAEAGAAAQAALAAAEKAATAAQSQADATAASLTAAERGADAAAARLTAAQAALAAAQAAADAAQTADVTAAQAAADTAQAAADEALAAVEEAKGANDDTQGAVAAAQAAADTAQAAADTAQAAVNAAQAAASTAQAASDLAQGAVVKALENVQAIAPPEITLVKGEQSGNFFWYDVSLSGFEPGATVRLSCRSTANPTGFFETSLRMGADGAASEDRLCFSQPGQDHWVTADDVESARQNW